MGSQDKLGDPPEGKPEKKADDVPLFPDADRKHISEVPRRKPQTADPQGPNATVRQYRILNRLTGALVFVTIAGVAVNILLWHQAAEQSDIAKVSSFAAVYADSLTERMLKESQANNVIANRPWVGVEDIGFAGGALGIRYKNYGKLPALHVRCAQASAMGIRRLMIGTFLADSSNLRGVGVVSPSDFAWQPISKADGISDEICVFGIVVYSDIFNEKDTTKFCKVFDSKSGTWFSVDGYNTMK
jgi:hypothetical protein